MDRSKQKLFLNTPIWSQMRKKLAHICC